ncbi:MAG: hypothetical protein EOP56_17645 [Sphingobacteriales bacterium]|nr:MAG: hypothetical protein EOP56_17645 [Sphingobacteriales bacterium]
MEIDMDCDPVLYQTVELLKEAINDWPTEIKTLEEFIENVEKYLHYSEITIEVVNKAASRIRLGEFWQVKALASIQELMKINDQSTFEAILNRLMLYPG